MGPVPPLAPALAQAVEKARRQRHPRARNTRALVRVHFVYACSHCICLCMLFVCVRTFLCVCDVGATLRGARVFLLCAKEAQNFLLSRWPRVGVRCCALRRWPIVFDFNLSCTHVRPLSISFVRSQFCRMRSPARAKTFLATKFRRQDLAPKCGRTKRV